MCRAQYILDPEDISAVCWKEFIKVFFLDEWWHLLNVIGDIFDMFQIFLVRKACEEDWSKNFMHSLSVAHIGMFSGVKKENFCLKEFYFIRKYVCSLKSRC